MTDVQPALPDSRDNAMVGRPASDAALRRLYAEAWAQYDLHPSDYLEGVLAGLSQVLDDTAHVPALRRHDQAAHARPPVDQSTGA